jgi:hypothetical protein
MTFAFVLQCMLRRFAVLTGVQEVDDGGNGSG